MLQNPSHIPLNYRIQSLFDIAQKLHRERRDLQDAFPLDDPDKVAAFWYWLHWQGKDDAFCSVASEVRRMAWPHPPAHLLGRVVGEENGTKAFDQGGLVDWRQIRSSLVRGGFDFGAGGSVLDFGVGCGRILRYFGLYSGSCRFVGADVDSEAVSWCRKNLEFARFEALSFDPPTVFADREFAAVYAFSVFSHLPERQHLRWLEELHRITRPGAVLVLTTMGRKCADLVVSGKREYPHPAPEVLKADLSKLEAEGYLFYPYEALTFQHQENSKHFADWDMKTYGSTYMTEKYVRTTWSRWFEIVSFDSAPDGWQDFIILRRRP